MQRHEIAARLESACRSLSTVSAQHLYSLALAALSVSAAAWSLNAVWRFTIDDAGISYAYAKHIAEGHGPVAAIGGPWVEGYSNPLWVLLLVPFHWLGLPLPLVAKWLGVALFAVTAVLGSGLIALDHGKTWRAPRAIEAGLSIALALCLEFVIWTVAGLENSLFCALLLLMAWLFAHPGSSRGRDVAHGLATFGLCITRPEGMLYAAPWLVATVVRGARTGRRRAALTAVLCWCVPLGLYHVAHYAVFRDVVPNTFYAKPASADFGRGYKYLVDSLTASGLVYALPLALVGSIGALQLRLLLVSSVAAGAAFITYSGGDWMPHARFLSLFAPAVLVLAALGVSKLARGLNRLSRGRVGLEIGALALTSGLLMAWSQHHAPRLSTLSRRPWCHFCERVADTQSLEKAAARAGLSHTSLLTHDFGGPAWLSDERFYPIDFLGLCDESVAKIRRRLSQTGGRLSHDFSFLQYLIHEQPEAPSWISIPPNFWRNFDLSPEFRLGYFRLEPRALRHTRRDAFFGLHRGELVDYFPPVRLGESRALSAGLSLVGSNFTSDPTQSSDGGVTVVPGTPLHTVVSIARRGQSRGGAELVLRVNAGSASVTSSALAIDRGITGVAAQIGAGEPISIEFDVTLPEANGAPYQVQLGVASGPAESPQFFDLGELTPGQPLPHYERTLPRFPAALPPPLDPELRTRRRAVTMAIERRRRLGHQIRDEQLSRELREMGERLEHAGTNAQAYLAYVWATQVDRRAWEKLADPVFRLRQTAQEDAFTSELSLLQYYFASPDRAALARLAGYYLSEGRPLEAQYFLESWPTDADPELHAALLGALQNQLQSSTLSSAESATVLALVAEDPIAGSSDFEVESLDGWQGDTGVFQRSERGGGLRGQHGSTALSSGRNGVKGRGTLLSPEFVLRGRLLSLLVGGGSPRSRVGVDLLVEGQRVRSARGNGSDFMYMQLWNVSEHLGKPARLRVFDESTNAHVLVDRVLSWR